LPAPTAAQKRWQDCELGAVFHFDLPVYLDEGWQWTPAYTVALDPDLYAPEALDTDQWLEAAKALGARYAIFTATHMSGFRQWQSESWPYGLRQTAWRRGKADIVAEFVESCRRHGVEAGLYVSVRFNAYWNATHGTPVYHGRGMAFGEQSGRDAYQAYLRSCEGMVEELCGRYGDLLELWFDGGVAAPDDGGPDVVPIFERHQPHGVFYHSSQRADHRWAGAEDGTAGDPCWCTITDVMSQYSAHGDPEQRRTTLRHGNPDGNDWVPAMADVPIRNHAWFWRPGEDGKLYASDDLVAMYLASVGRNANLMVGLTPNRDGLVPDADLRVCEDVGRKLRRAFGEQVACESGEGTVLELLLAEPARVDKVVMMEDIAHGHRIRGWVLEAITGGSGDFVKIASGTAVGHKRIECFPPRQVARVRLRITESVGVPVVQSLAAYGGA